MGHTGKDGMVLWWGKWTLSKGLEVRPEQLLLFELRGTADF